jgi:hypothetical protein
MRRTVAILASSTGASSERFELEKGVRWLQVVSGAKPGVIAYLERPTGAAGDSLLGGVPIERLGQVVYVGGHSRTLELYFPPSSSSSDDDLVIESSFAEQPPQAWPAPETQPVSGTFWQTTQPISIAATVATSLDYDQHLAERLDIDQAISRSISNSQFRTIMANESEITFPAKWRSVNVLIGAGSHSTSDLDLVLVIQRVSDGQTTFLGRHRNNKYAGGFPVVSFAPPPYIWNLGVGNFSGANVTVSGHAFYSTSEPSNAAIG